MQLSSIYDYDTIAKTYVFDSLFESFKIGTLSCDCYFYQIITLTSFLFPHFYSRTMPECRYRFLPLEPSQFVRLLVPVLPAINNTTSALLCSSIVDFTRRGWIGMPSEWEEKKNRDISRSFYPSRFFSSSLTDFIIFFVSTLTSTLSQRRRLNNHCSSTQENVERSDR